jgi:hypothetical protein
MRKLKVFFVAASLLMTCVGLFSWGSSKSDTYIIYAEDGTSYILFADGLTSGMSLTRIGASSQICVESGEATNYCLWYYDITHPGGVAQKAVYPDF